MNSASKNYQLYIICLSVFLLILPSMISCGGKKSSSAPEFLKEIRDSLDTSDSSQLRLANRIDSLLQSPDPENDLYNAVDGYCNFLHMQGKQSEAIDLYSKIVKYYESIDSPTIEDIQKLLDLYVALGAAVEELGMKNMAMNYYMRGMEIAEKYNCFQQKAMLLNNIGVIYFGVGDYDRAYDYFEKSSQINLQNSDKKVKNRELFINYNNISEVFLKKDDYEKAMDYSLKALQFLDEKEDASLYYMMHSNIGMIYGKRNNYAMSISYLQNAILHQKKINLNSYLIESYITLSEVHKDFNQPDSASLYVDKAITLSREVNNVASESKALQCKAELARDRGDYAASVALLERATQLKDSIQAMDNRKKMEDWEKVYETDRETQRASSIISSWNPENIFYVMLTLAFILICVIIIIYLAKKKSDKTLLEKSLAHKEKERITNERLEIEERHKSELQEEVDRRNRELTTYTLERLKTNECITEITEELKRLLLEINPRSKEHREHIQQILKKLLHLGQRNDWDEFQYYFEKVHPSFYIRLDEQCPGLTPKEKRLCAFIVLGLSTKEIAAITFREVRSMESSRNRLRKKLGLSSETNLTEYLRQITLR